MLFLKMVGRNKEGLGKKAESILLDGKLMRILISSENCSNIDALISKHRDWVGDVRE